MQQAYKILPPDIVPSETNFYCEVCNDSLSFFFQNNENKMITGLSVFNFENLTPEHYIANSLAEIFDKEKIFQNKYNRIFISYGFNESILIPGLYYNRYQNNENINLLFGDVNRGIILTDHVEEKNLYNTYRIPGDVHEVVINNFSEATFIHRYSLLIKQLQYIPDLLEVIFYRNNIIIVLQKESKLQIIQTFIYATAGDVLYHMLNVCNHFNAKDVNVQLSGMIEKESALFKEIEKYFLNITFAVLPGKLLYADEIKKFSPHFFSHLFAIALCV